MNASDFLVTNGGRLDPVWFQPHNLTTLLTAWLGNATGNDASQEAQVYARAYAFLADKVMSTAATERVGAVTVTVSSEQLRYWRDQAAWWRRKAAALTGDGGPVLTQWEGRPLWRN